MRKPLLLAILCGVIAVLFVALYLSGLETTYRKSAEKVKVLAARQYIDQGTTLTADFLEEKLVPKDYLQPRAIQAVKELTDSEGRAIFITLVPIEKGEQIITTKLSMLGVETGISSIIPTDKRAVSVVFEADEVVGMIKPGNRVDIIGVFEYRDKEGQMQEESATILQNVLVLSVGRSIFGAAGVSDKDLKKLAAMNNESGRVPVSFAVAPAQVEMVALASEKGSIRLSLRPVGDDTIYDTKNVKMQNLFGNMAVSAQVANKDKTAIPEEYLREMQKKQREAMEILRKYQKR